MRLSIVCILVSMAQCLCAQHDVLRFTGTIGLWEKDSTLHGATITAVDTADVARIFSCEASNSGKCRLKLPLDRGYRITFSAAGHVAEHVIVNATGPGVKQRKWGYDIRLKLVLMPNVPGVDHSICGKPMGLAHYAAGPNQFEWDERHQLDLQPYLETMQNAYENTKAPK